MEGNHYDKGTAWVILAAAMVTGVLSASIYTAGIFNLIFLEVFGESKALTAWVPAVMSSLLSLAGPIGGILTKHFGCRITMIIGGMVSGTGLALASLSPNFAFLFVTFGVITGTGLGILYTPSIVILGYHFKKYLPLAVGISGSTVGIGIMTLPHLVQYLLDTYSWRGAILLYGGIHYQFCVLGAFMRPPPKLSFRKSKEDNKGKLLDYTRDTNSITQTNDPKKQVKDTAPTEKEESVQNGYSNHRDDIIISDLDAMDHLNDLVKRPRLYKNFKYIFFCVSLFAVAGGMSSIFMHFQAFAISNGVERHTSNFLMSIAGLGAIIGRCISGFCMCQFKLPGLGMYMVFLSVAGLFTVALPIYGKTLNGCMVYAVVMGFFGNTYPTFCSPILIDLVGIEDFAMAHGLFLMVGGISYLLCPVLAGWMYDSSLSYSNSLYLAGGFIFAAVLAATLCVQWKCCPRYRCVCTKSKCDANLQKHSGVDSTKENFL